MDDLTWNIWPCDEVSRVTEILEKHPDLIERRHGLKQETALHRSDECYELLLHLISVSANCNL